MRCSILSAGLLALTAAAAPSIQRSARLDTRNPASGGQVAFQFPLPNGFPNVAAGSATLKEIEQAAHGTLPNGALPSKISDTSATVWSLIATNELFEVAYFSSLVKNITDWVPGYEVGSPAAREIVLGALKAVVAQEELHALGANGILAAAGRTTIQPCKYVFPVNNFDDALAFASTFTDVVLGTLQSALSSFGLDGDAGFLGLVGSVIGQEGEQNGFYRALSPHIKIPSALPFLTASAGPFALSALQQLVIVPGSCPSKLDIPTFGALTIETKNVGPHTETISFSLVDKEVDIATVNKWNLVYINQQNKPVVEKLQGAK